MLTIVSTSILLLTGDISVGVELFSETEGIVVSTREFFYRDDVSDKFWTIAVDGPSTVTTSGRIGRKARRFERSFESESAAVEWADRQVEAKIGKGYEETVLATLTPWSPPQWSTLDMNVDVFWRIIALFDWRHVGDDEAVMRRAIDALGTMSEPSIQTFSDILATLLHSFDTREYCRHIYSGRLDPDYNAISSDDFLYKRCDLIANGRAYYELVRSDPSKVIQDCEFEALLNLDAMAFEVRHPGAYEYVSPISYESFTNIEGWTER
ncbi:DUF4240 domain-containing protein [Herbiconiux sp.]|uniref:DUF4240 domain-containing protein n=1 Tax=Herbiconiux sp. TaxID=1871186 RepID=UPI0025B84E57|nr:DUF4240 domain-containing protein [Herbiconiux sp.]